MTCLVLRDGKYIPEVEVTGYATVTPSLFPGLTIDLTEIWPVVESDEE